jgi:hypothetical protein
LVQQRSALSQGPPALLLVPPQLAVQGVELVRQAVEADGTSADASWHADMAVRVTAIYGACYQALWGAKVLQSAEAYQLLFSAARLRMLLRTGAEGGLVSAAAAADDEAAAEAALLTHNAVGSRRRRLPSGPQGPGGAAGGELPAVKRLKTNASSAATSDSDAARSGDAVNELLQLFQQPEGQQQQPAVVGSEQRGQQQQEQQGPQGRKRITAVPVQQEQPPPQQQAAAAPGRRRIVPQQIAPPPIAAAGGQALGAGSDAQQQAEAEQAESGDEGRQQGADEEDGEDEESGREERGQQRVVITKTANMTGDPAPPAAPHSTNLGLPGVALPAYSTSGLSDAHMPALLPCSAASAACFADEQREEMWAAYIADKELLVEMLGVSC